MFDLDPGHPTDFYGLEEAIEDGFLVPFDPISLPTKFMRDGIRYDDLSEEEKDQWDELEWGESGRRDEVTAGEINTYLFNSDTVDKVLAHVMSHGIRVNGGDRIGKTIIFAANNDPAPRASGPFPTPIVLSQTEIETVGLQSGGRLRLLDGFMGDQRSALSMETEAIASVRSLTAEANTSPRAYTLRSRGTERGRVSCLKVCMVAGEIHRRCRSGRMRTAAKGSAMCRDTHLLRFTELAGMRETLEFALFGERGAARCAKIQ
jgi:hypothetical protein